MTERQKVSIEKVGDEATGKVVYVNEVKTKYGPRIAFVLNIGGTEYELPLIAADTATKRLERIGLTTATAVGEHLRFWRKENPSGRPFWEIDVAAQGQPAPTKRLTAAEALKPAPTAKAPHTSGPPIAGLDDEPEPYRAGDDDPEFEAWSASLDALNPTAQPKQTPREVAAHTDRGDKQESYEAAYCGLYGRVLRRLMAAHDGTEVPLDSGTVHAATFSLYKLLSDKGLA